jgi:hypothetical protein
MNIASVVTFLICIILAAWQSNWNAVAGWSCALLGAIQIIIMEARL